MFFLILLFFDSITVFGYYPLILVLFDFIFQGSIITILTFLDSTILWLSYSCTFFESFFDSTLLFLFWVYYSFNLLFFSSSMLWPFHSLTLSFFISAILWPSIILRLSDLIRILEGFPYLRKARKKFHVSPFQPRARPPAGIDDTTDARP